jgi:hypothetical protein
MTTTYDPALPTDKDVIRFLLQDTNADGEGDWFVQDEEIAYIISQWKPRYGTLEMVAAVMADVIAARYAREVSYSADGVSINLGAVGQQFRELAASLREQHRSALVGGFPDVGGVSPYEGPLPDVRPFIFGTGMHDDLSAGRQDYGSRDFPEYYPEDNPGV